MKIEDERVIQQKEIMAEFSEETIEITYLWNVYFNFFLTPKFLSRQTYDCWY